MDEPASPSEANGRAPFRVFERLAAAALDAFARTAERADQVADEIADRGGIRRDEARSLVEDTATRWRGDAARLGQLAGVTLNGVFDQVGLVRREELEELELRVAQLEHRLRLLEDPPTPR